MVTVDEKYCFKCCDYTPHNYVGSRSEFEGLGIVRGILAVASLGVSESVGRTKHWQCSKCGKIKED